MLRAEGDINNLRGVNAEQVLPVSIGSATEIYIPFTANIVCMINVLVILFQMLFYLLDGSLLLLDFISRK